MKNSVKMILIILLLILFFGLGYYMVIFEPNNLQIEKKDLVLKDLPQAFDGVKIAHLTDIHSLWFGSREKRVLEILEELEPDFVFITGDFVDPITKITDRELSSVKIFWQELGKRYSGRIFAVLGNHDTKATKDYLIESGIRVLNNEHEKIFFGVEEEISSSLHFADARVKDYIYLIGVGDPRTGRDNLSKAIKGVKKETSKILLAHAPEIINEAVNKKIDLVLVGDTHGGQINIPILEKLQPLSKYGRKYTKGIFRIGSTYLYVNRGIGTSVFPIRFNCPPEIALIEIRSK